MQVLIISLAQLNLGESPCSTQPWKQNSIIQTSPQTLIYSEIMTSKPLVFLQHHGINHQAKCFPFLTFVFPRQEKDRIKYSHPKLCPLVLTLITNIKCIIYSLKMDLIYSNMDWEPFWHLINPFPRPKKVENYQKKLLEFFWKTCKFETLIFQ